MIIREIEIKAFGRLENRRMAFGEGMNLIQGENETGKTTLHAFIRAMLFGMERGRGRASREDEYTRYRPWKNPGNYGGHMDLEAGGKEYRLIRDFAKDGRNLSACDKATGEEIPDFEERILRPAGINESNYRNAMWIAAEKAPSSRELADGLGDRLIHMATGGDRELAASRAISWLESRKKQTERERLPEKLAALEEKGRQAREWETENKSLRKEYQELEEKLYRNDMLSGEGGSAEEDMELERAAQVSQAAAQLRSMRQASGSSGTATGILYFLLGMGCLILFAALRLVLPLAAATAIPVFLYAAAVLAGLLRSRKKRQQRKQNQAEREELILQKGKLSARIEQLERQLEEMNGLEQEQAEMQKRVQARAEEQEILTAAAEILRQVSGEMKAGFGTEFTRSLGKAMKEITSGGHERLYLDEDFRIKLEEDGQIQPLDRFSKGMAEQMNLVMSLSAGGLLFREPAPLLLDDAFVHYDTERMQRALEYLTQKHPGQILLCSCTAREAEAMEEAGIPYRYLNMKEELKD